MIVPEFYLSPGVSFFSVESPLVTTKVQMEEGEEWFPRDHPLAQQSLHFGPELCGLSFYSFSLTPWIGTLSTRNILRHLSNPE